MEKGARYSTHTTRCTHQAIVTQPILQQCIPYSPGSPEHNSSGEEDLKTVHEEAIDGELEAQ